VKAEVEQAATPREDALLSTSCCWDRARFRCCFSEKRIRIVSTEETGIDPRAQTLAACAADEASAYPSRPRSSWALLVLSTIAVLAALYVARDVIVPMVFALLLALLFRPVLRHMKRYRIPNGVSALVLVGTLLVFFLLGMMGLAGQAQRWLADAPEMVRGVNKMLPANVGLIVDWKETTKAVEELTGGEAVHPPQPQEVEVQSQDWVYAALGVSSHFVGASVIVFVLCYFLLALSDQLMKKAVEAMPSFCEKRNVVQLVQNVESGISRYLATITAINIALGIVTGLAMWLLGLPNPVLWGVMATALNYVPHLGAIICMVVLFFVGAIAHQSIAWGVASASTFVLITSTESYFVTPMILSRSLRVSPLAVILAILFWGWLWGIGGGLLAAPLLTVFKIICDQFESMRPVAALLSVGESAVHSGLIGQAPASAPAKQAA